MLLQLWGMKILRSKFKNGGVWYDDMVRPLAYANEGLRCEDCIPF